MLRCRSLPRLEELSLAIRENDLDFATAAIRFSEGPESAQGGRIGPISPEAGHPELNRVLAQANEGDLIGPFPIGDMHVLLRLDTRITTRLMSSYRPRFSRSSTLPGWIVSCRLLRSVTASSPPSTFQPYDCIYVLKIAAAAGLCSTQPC